MILQTNKILFKFFFFFFLQASFDWEFSEYEKYINEKYGLCKTCDIAFKREIKEQDTQIREMYSEEFNKLKPFRGLRKLRKKVYIFLFGR